MSHVRRLSFLYFMIALLFILTATVFSSHLPTVDANYAPVKVLVNGKVLTSDVNPFIENSRTYVPLRFVAEAFQAKVVWDPMNKNVTVSHRQDKLVYTIGSSTYTHNGNKKSMDVPAKIVNGRTFIPIRFIADPLNFEVNWNGSTKTVSISNEKIGPISVTDMSGRTVQLSSPAKRIATLSSGDMDIALNLGATIVGRPTSFVTPPKGLEEVPQIGNAHQIDFEKLTSVKPDLLLAPLSARSNLDKFERLNIPVVFLSAASIQDIQKEINIVGKILNKENEANALIQKIDERIKTYAGKSTKVKALIVYGAPGTTLAALPNSLPGDILAKAGGVNIAKDFPASKDQPSFAELSAERIIIQNPDVIFLIAHGNPKEVQEAFEKILATDPAWKNLNAVKNSQYQVLDPNLFAANPGTKIVDALDQMYNALSKVNK